MKESKKSRPPKAKLHPRNQHQGQYDFALLIKSNPTLAEYVKPNDYGTDSIDFSNPKAVKALNQSLLQHYYNIDLWDIPEGHLCPPIPGRADYIHHMADLLSNNGVIPKGQKIHCLDIGVGANCIYPLIGNHEYGWSFVGSDISPESIHSAQIILNANPRPKSAISLRLQANPKFLFTGIINQGEVFDLTICNPPFHASAEEALQGSKRKTRNLKQKRNTKTVLNFGGQSNELWCNGGERVFVYNMIQDSIQHATSCLWFSTLLSKESNLIPTRKTLEKAGAVAIKVIPMGQGNKTSRIVAWSFLSKEQQDTWKKLRWAK